MIICYVRMIFVEHRNKFPYRKSHGLFIFCEFFISLRKKLYSNSHRHIYSVLHFKFQQSPTRALLETKFTYCLRKRWECYAEYKKKRETTNKIKKVETSIVVCSIWRRERDNKSENISTHILHSFMADCV